MSKPKGVVKKTMHTKAANMNTTSTSKVVQTGIKRKSAVTIARAVSKRSKDDEEDEDDIDITVHSQKLFPQENVKNAKNKQTYIRISFQKNDLKIKYHLVIVNIFHSTNQSIFHAFFHY